MTVTPQLKAILLAGGLAIVALVLGFFTLSMNQSSSNAAPPKTIMPLHLRDKAKTASAAPTAKPAAAKAKVTPKPKAKPKPKVDPAVREALHAGLPRAIATQFATHRVVVVSLFSNRDDVDELARAEAESGAALAGAGFVGVNVAREGATSDLTKLIGSLPPTPAVLVYARPATLYVTLPGFNDRTTVQQAAANADPDPTAARAGATKWAAQASALCEAAVAASTADPAASPAQAKAGFDRIMGEFLAKMRALKPAPGEATKVAQLNSMLAENVQLIDSLLTAAAKNDLAAAGAVATKQQALGRRINALERELGATGCSEISVE